MAEGDPQSSGTSNAPNMPEEDPRTSQRIFKKTSSNNKITLYIARRDLVLEPNRAERVEGVLLVDPEYAENRNIYGQIIVIFRYGRQDEEIMGLQFFNETIVNMVRIWPTCHSQRTNSMSSLQETLVRRLGPNAIPFHMELFNTAPPSVVLSPTKPYDGQPVGTSYDVRIFMEEEPGDMVCRPLIVRMGIRVTHGAARIDSAPLLTPSPSNESFRLKPRYQRIKYDYCDSEFIADRGHPLVKMRLILSLRTSPIKSRLKDLKAKVKTLAQIETETVNEESLESGDQKNDQRNAVNEHREEKNQVNEGKSNRSEERSDSNEETQGNEEISVETESAIPVGPRPAPRVKVEKAFLLSDGKLHLESWLDKSSYHHGERIVVNFRIVNNSKKTVQRIKAFVYQYVDVCMFNNGKFKNVVAMAKDKNSSVPPGQRFQDYYTMRPRRVVTKNWIALEGGSVSHPEGTLASTVVCQPEESKRRGISSIFVTYYVKLTLYMNRLGGELSVKLPFSLSRAPIQESSASDSTTEESANKTEKDDNDEDDCENDDNKDDVNDGMNIGNQVSNSEVNPGGRQSILADVSVHIIENKLGEGPFEELPLAHAAKSDGEELNPLVRYLESNI